MMKKIQNVFKNQAEVSLLHFTNICETTYWSGFFKYRTFNFCLLLTRSQLTVVFFIAFFFPDVIYYSDGFSLDLTACHQYCQDQLSIYCGQYGMSIWQGKVLTNKTIQILIK